MRELKNLNFGGYSRPVNQSRACSSSDVITSRGRKSETTMEDKVIMVVCGSLELYIHLRTFTKTGIHFATRLKLPGRSPSHDAYSRLLCSEFHARMARVNSKCSSVQLCANSAIYSLHSHLVWTHLKVTKLQKCWKVHLAVVVNICFHRSCGDWVAWSQSDTKTRSCDVFPGRSSYHTQHAGLCPLVQWDRTTTWEQRRVRRPSSRAWCY